LKLIAALFLTQMLQKNKHPLLNTTQKFPTLSNSLMNFKPQKNKKKIHLLLKILNIFSSSNSTSKA
jgi:hypothetical protein